MIENLLSGINNPSDLKRLSIAQLSVLAKEIRDLIVETVAKNGGHLSSNLGVVELTLALHYVFDAEQDRIVWDVGHQCYTHKILTGRRDLFHTIRTEGGLAGFPRPLESSADSFRVGHASTSISAALGLAWSRDLSREKRNILAVIGDGSLSGGMAFEGLNHAGHLKTDIIFVLNDNEMAISPTVGALSAYLNKILADPIYNRVKDEIRDIVRRIPGLGEPLLNVSGRVEESLKSLLVPGVFFEELGIRYFGPIDGHNLKNLVDTFRDLKTNRGPRLVHVITQKGKGFPPSEIHPDRFHGTSSFALIRHGKHASDWNISSSEEEEKGRAATYTEAFSAFLLDIAKQDPRVVAITAAMPKGTGLDVFRDHFQDRFVDVGIAEQHAVTFAAALAISGKRPVVAIYSTFLQRSYDQILHDVCLQNLPVVFMLDRAGLVGEDGPTHHGIFDIAFLSTMPNMVCMAPKDQFELGEMLRFALSHSGPCAIRYPRGRGLGQPLARNSHPLTLGESEWLTQGNDVAILAYGSMVQPALNASYLLGEEGIECRVINLRFASPLDATTLLAAAQETQLLVTVEEHDRVGGVGSRVLELLAESGLNVPCLCLGLSHDFPPHGSREVLLRKQGLDSSGIAESIHIRFNQESRRRPIHDIPCGVAGKSADQDLSG